MLKLLLIFLCFLPLNKIYGEDNSKDTTKYWEKKDTLTWTDFQGQIPKDSDTESGLEGLAATVAEIEIAIDKINNNVTFKVICFFVKTKSWHKNNSITILMHEQLHFDIAELFARKIRKELDSLKLNKVTDTLYYTDKINELMMERHRIDSLYDCETLHGAVDFMQLKWHERINKELEDLKEYEVDYNEYIKE